MSHLLPFMLCLAGFAGLAFAMDRQQRNVIGRPLKAAATYVLRVVGACVLLCALGLLVTWNGWGLALVIFSGHTSLAAGLVYCGLLAYVKMDAR